MIKNDRNSQMDKKGLKCIGVRNGENFAGGKGNSRKDMQNISKEVAFSKKKMSEKIYVFMFMDAHRRQHLWEKAVQSIQSSADIHLFNPFAAFSITSTDRLSLLTVNCH